MLLRDQPTIEVTQRVGCDVATAWGYVTDIGLPASGVSIAIAEQPDKEARIIAGRLSEWQQGMQANLDWIRSRVEG